MPESSRQESATREARGTNQDNYLLLPKVGMHLDFLGPQELSDPSLEGSAASLEATSLFLCICIYACVYICIYKYYMCICVYMYKYGKMYKCTMYRCIYV